MTYVELLREYASQEGIVELQVYGQGWPLFEKDWFAPANFSGDPESTARTLCDIITGPSEDVTDQVL